jgi:hypothetical protein
MFMRSYDLMLLCWMVVVMVWNELNGKGYLASNDQSARFPAVASCSTGYITSLPGTGSRLGLPYYFRRVGWKRGRIKSTAGVYRVLH